MRKAPLIFKLKHLSKIVLSVALVLVCVGSLQPPVAHAQEITCKLPDGSVKTGYSLAGCKLAGGTLGETAAPAGGGGNDFSCGVTSGQGIASCVASLVYYIGPGLASNVAYVGAYMFSYAVSLSLNSVAYALDFLSAGWTTVRDLANMAFILILVYIAFKVMFMAEERGTLQMLAWVIFIALIINFSFFLTRVVIDAGNILAVQFYNAIPAGSISGGNGTFDAAGLSGVKDLSYSVMAAVNFQSLFETKTFELAQAAAGNSVMGGLIVLTLIYVAVAVMFWILFFVFLQVGIKFLMRIVILWFVIISAPLALVARAIPKDGAKELYSRWQGFLIQYSFYPAIFLFMYMIIVKFIQQMLNSAGGGNLISNIFNGGLATNSFNAAAGSANVGVASAIANVGIRMGFIVAMFYIALKASDWIVTAGGEFAHGLTNKVTGGTLGTAAFAGRLGVGRLIGGTIANSRLANTGGILSRGLGNTGRFLNNRTYDARNLPGVTKGVDLLSRTHTAKDKYGTGINIGKGHTQTGAKLEENMFAVGNWMFGGPSEAAKKKRKEVNERIEKVEMRQNVKELGKLNTKLAPAEKEIDRIKTEEASAESLIPKAKKIEKQKKDQIDAMNAAGVTTPAQLAARDRLEDELRQMTAARQAAERKQADLKTERKGIEDKTEQDRYRKGILSKRVEGMSAPQMTSFSTGNIEAIVKQISESNLKAIKESNKYSNAAIEKLTKAWHEQNKKAPMMKSREDIEKLEKVHAKLADDLSISIDSIVKRGTPAGGGDTVITIKAAKDVKEAFEEEKDKQEVKKQGADGPTAKKDRTEAQMAINELTKAIKKVDGVIENLEKVPEDVGGRPASGEFIIKKT